MLSRDCIGPAPSTGRIQACNPSRACINPGGRTTGTSSSPKGCYTPAETEFWSAQHGTQKINLKGPGPGPFSIPNIRKWKSKYLNPPKAHC